MIFLIDWQWIWFKNYFEDIKSRKSSSILMKIRKMLLFSESFSVSISFHYQSEIICVIQIKKKRINFLFIAVIYFTLSIQMNMFILYTNCYLILTTHMLDSGLEPSYNLSKTPLIIECREMGRHLSISLG